MPRNTLHRRWILEILNREEGWLAASEIFDRIKQRRGKLRHALSSVRIGGIASRTRGIEKRWNPHKGINEYRVYMDEGTTP